MAQVGPAAAPKKMRSQCVDPFKFLEGYDDLQYVLGQGSYGVVSKYKCRSTGRDCAIKVQTLRGARDMTAWLREELALEASAQSRNPDASNVVKLFESCLSPLEANTCYGYLVLQHCETSLEVVLNCNCDKPLPEALWWTSNLFCGLSFIHSIDILHRDIKPSNTLLVLTSTDRWDLKIADFGSSRAPAHEMTAGVTTLQYQAPEILMSAAISQAGPAKTKQHNSIHMISTSCAF